MTPRLVNAEPCPLPLPDPIVKGVELNNENEKEITIFFFCFMSLDYWVLMFIQLKLKSATKKFVELCVHSNEKLFDEETESIFELTCSLTTINIRGQKREATDIE